MATKSDTDIPKWVLSPATYLTPSTTEVDAKTVEHDEDPQPRIPRFKDLRRRKKKAKDQKSLRVRLLISLSIFY